MTTNPFPIIDPPGPLLCPITSAEVGRAVIKINSDRACGPDGTHGIPNELIKAVFIRKNLQPAV